MKGKSAESEIPIEASGLSINFFIAIIVIFMSAIAGIIIAKTAFLSLLIIPFLIVAIVLTFLIFKNPELGWFLIIFFLPFERVPTYEVGGINIKINTLLGFLTLFAWVLALAFSPYAKASGDKNPKKY